MQYLVLHRRADAAGAVGAAGAVFSNTLIFCHLYATALWTILKLFLYYCWIVNYVSIFIVKMLQLKKTCRKSAWITFQIAGIYITLNHLKL